MSETKTCLECGRKFIPHHCSPTRQKYCSKRCSDKFWNLSIEERKNLKDLIKENKGLKKEIRSLKKQLKKGG